MVLTIQEASRARDISIRAGDVINLPLRVPHSLQRMPGLPWCCESRRHRLYDGFLNPRNIETHVPAVFDCFQRRLDARTCDAFGHAHTCELASVTGVASAAM